MIKIIYPPTIRYDHLFQRPQQLMNAFAALDTGNTSKQVFFVDALPTQKEFITEKGLHVVPYSYDIKRLTQEKRVLWISYPPTGKQMIEKYKPDFIVFDIIDAPSGEFEHWQEDWDYLLNIADIVFASAHDLLELASERKLNPISNICLLPNACDYAHFQYTRNVVPHNERPVIGFVGALASWLDWDLICEIVKERPQYDFKFVGPIYNQCGVNRLFLSPNVNLVGHVDYNELPAQMADMDMLIMPFDIKNPICNSVNPVKMFEYCATGKPILSTQMREANIDVIDATSESDWLDQMDYILKNTREGRNRRLSFALSNTWEIRAQCAFREIYNSI
jgi:hypothetical protein